MAKRKTVQPRVTEVTVIVAGMAVTTDSRPWCDCARPEWKGLTRRADGIWVRVCCMRRPKEMYDRFADEPVHTVNGASA